MLLDSLGHATSKDIHHVVLHRHLLLLLLHRHLLLHSCRHSRPENVEEVIDSSLCHLLIHLHDWCRDWPTHQHSIEIEEVPSNSSRNLRLGLSRYLNNRLGLLPKSRTLAVLVLFVFHSTGSRVHKHVFLPRKRNRLKDSLYLSLFPLSRLKDLQVLARSLLDLHISMV